MYIYIDVVVANVEATARKYVEKGHFAAIKQKSSITLVIQTIWHTMRCASRVRTFIQQIECFLRVKIIQLCVTAGVITINSITASLTNQQNNQ